MGDPRSTYWDPRRKKIETTENEKCKKKFFLLWGKKTVEFTIFIFLTQHQDAPFSVEKREPSYTVGGNVNWCSHYGKQYGGSKKTKDRVAI